MRDGRLTDADRKGNEVKKRVFRAQESTKGVCKGALVVGGRRRAR